MEVEDLDGYTCPPFFRLSTNGAMGFSAPVDGATTSGSNYARSELREMADGDEAAWTLNRGGSMHATLNVKEVPTEKGGDAGRVIIGQIHGPDDELCRLYYDGGRFYFVD